MLVVYWIFYKSECYSNSIIVQSPIVLKSVTLGSYILE